MSQALLRPARHLLEDRRLLISTDGALAYLPFGALPRPSEPEGDTAEPLLVRHAVIAIPSASAAAYLARRPGRAVQLLTRTLAKGVDCFSRGR